MKKIVRQVLLLLYLGAVALSSLIIINPGASIFYVKRTIDVQSVAQDAGFAYRYKLSVDARFINTQAIRLYEGGKKLNLAGQSIVASYGNRTYAITQPSRGTVYIYFSAADNSNPITNAKTYTLNMPLRIITRPSGIILLAILSPLIIWFLVFALVHADNRQTITRSLGGILQVVDLFSERLSQRTGSYFRWLWQQVKARAFYWKDLLTITVLAAFFYIFMEWVFFVTMPSFMSLMSWFNKMEIFLLSGLAFSFFCLVIVAAFLLVDVLGIAAHLSRITWFLGMALPAIILSALALLLLDNFTYTIFKFGISTSTGIARGVYALLFILLFGLIYWRMLGIFGFRDTGSAGSRINHRWFFASLGLIVLSMGIGLANVNYTDILAGNASSPTQEVSRLPNILLLGSDGVNADDLSAYGYARNTTPRLKELAQSSLVAENAFTNAGNTAGSVISIMTSKLPTQTRVLYPPDILNGLNAYQHLPGILNNLGYETVEYGVPFYIDAYNFNLQNGFDVVNNRTIRVGKLGDIARNFGFENEVYFLTRLTWRISDRILHIFFIREMQNPYDIVTQPVPNITDQAKVNQLLSLFDRSQDPLFIHVHLLGTHGGYYNPEIRVFSKGENQPEPWLTDFYDDTLLGFDSFIGQVIDHLKAIGQFDNTILIIYTDHNKEFKVDGRIPLIIHFPGGAHAGQITSPAENIDIAPTILDYLGLSQPNWMEGESLLKGNAIDQRLIFSGGTTKVKPNEQDISFLDPALNKPPFYQFSYVNVIDCQKWYSFDLTTFKWTWGNVSGYVDPCGPQELLSAEQIKQAIYQRLAHDGFDISSLP